MKNIIAENNVVGLRVNSFLLDKYNEPDASLNTFILVLEFSRSCVQWDMLAYALA